MADLVTHVAVANLLGKSSRDDRTRALFLVGNCLPDVAYKGMLWVLGAPNWYCEPANSPLALIPLCFALALLFEEPWRRRAFGALLLGCWLHLLLDMGKTYLDHGVILWAFPFSMARVELGWYHPADMTWMFVPSLGLLIITELLARRLGRPL